MDPHRQAPRSLQWFFLLLWLCLLGSLYFVLLNNQEITPYLIPVWLAAGLGASLSVGRLADSRREGAQSVCLKLRRRRYPILPLLAILLIGSFFRLYKVDQWPPGLWVDEAHTAANALVLGGAGMPWASPFQSTPLIMKGWVETSNLYLYLCRLHLAVGGVNYLSIKSFSYVYGILAVAGLYFFLCAAVGPRAAFFAAFLMAVGKWPVAISRWGWDCVFLTAAQLPAWYCLAKGWRTGRGKSFSLAGWWTGLALYSYASALVLPAAHLLLLLALPFCKGRASSRVRRLQLVLLYLAGFVIAAFPFIIHASQDTDTFLVRIKGASAASGLSQTSEIFQTYSRNLVRHLLMFNVIGDPNVRHGIAREPVMDKVTGVLFLVGVLTALLRIRRPFHLSLLLWLMVGLAVGYLSVPIESPQTYRTLLVAPAAFGLAGLGLRSLLQLFRRAFKAFRRRGFRRWSFGVLILVVALSIGTQNYADYFLRYVGDPSVGPVFYGVGATRIAKEIRAAKERGEIVAVESTLGEPMEYSTNLIFNLLGGPADDPSNWPRIKKQLIPVYAPATSPLLQSKRSRTKLFVPFDRKEFVDPYCPGATRQIVWTLHRLDQPTYVTYLIRRDPQPAQISAASVQPPQPDKRRWELSGLFYLDKARFQNWTKKTSGTPEILELNGVNFPVDVSDGATWKSYMTAGQQELRVVWTADAGTTPSSPVVWETFNALPPLLEAKTGNLGLMLEFTTTRSGILPSVPQRVYSLSLPYEMQSGEAAVWKGYVYFKDGYFAFLGAEAEGHFELELDHAQVLNVQPPQNVGVTAKRLQVMKGYHEITVRYWPATTPPVAPKILWQPDFIHYRPFPDEIFCTKPPAHSATGK